MVKIVYYGTNGKYDGERVRNSSLEAVILLQILGYSYNLSKDVFEKRVGNLVEEAYIVPYGL